MKVQVLFNGDLVGKPFAGSKIQTHDFADPHFSNF